MWCGRTRLPGGPGREMRKAARIAGNETGRDSGYETDEHEWIARQADALCGARLDDLGRHNLAEFLTEMTARDRRELRSRLTMLLSHF
jgi:hypothetical protein